MRIAEEYEQFISQMTDQETLYDKVKKVLLDLMNKKKQVSEIDTCFFLFIKYKD